jgi:hypothetical protein
VAHNAEGSVKIRSFFYSAYTQRRYHRDCPEIPPGHHREADRYLELHATTDLREIEEFMRVVLLEGRRITGCLIAVLDEP